MTLLIAGCASNQVAPEPQVQTIESAATNADQATTLVEAPIPTVPRTTKNITSALSVQGRLTDARLSEVSGLAASNLNANRLWAINDSGNLAELYALSLQATVEQVWPVAAQNRDWEALAAASIDGIPYLVIADTGDNLAVYEESFIHLIKEPGNFTNTNKRLTPTSTLRFAYPDRPHNVEALAVSGMFVYLLTKERLSGGIGVPSRIYRLKLQGNESESAQTAVYLGSVQMPTRNLKTRLLTKFLNLDPIQPTDLVITRDDNHAYVLNYLHVLHYERSEDESWQEAFSKTPTVIHHHGLRQAEALTASAHGHIWLTSEKTGARLLAFKGAQSTNASRVSP